MPAKYFSFISLFSLILMILPGCEDVRAEPTRVPAATVADKPPETVIIEKEVEKIVKEYVTSAPLREFSSVDELRNWCEEHTAVLLVPDARGMIDLRSPTPHKKDDCDDYAERLQRLAIADGYLMSEQLVYDGKLLGVEVTPEKSYHMGNLTTIGNDVYFIEPQPSIFRIIKVCERD